MAISYEIRWQLTEVTCISIDGPYTDVVNSASWLCFGIGTNDDWTTSYASSESGKSEFGPPGTPYIPKSDLTDIDILNWIWNSGVNKDAVEAQVLENIIAQFPQ